MANQAKLKKNKEAALSVSRRELRVGQGYDVHPLAAGRSLYIGGVKIPYRQGLKGHSDADVLLHAVMDALLGAAGKGDIGGLFPNTDRRWQGADSRELLRTVHGAIAQERWKVVNLDCTVLAEAPKLRPYFQAMSTVMGEILGVEPERCAVKATTCERLGYIGRREGIAATAVVLLEREAEA